MVKREIFVNMKLFLCIFALIGVSSALLPGHHYYYYYTAETTVGIPEISPTNSVVGLRSNVSIEVVDNERLVIQMTNVQVATNIRKIKGGMHGYPNPELNYAPISGEGRALEEPFLVFFRREKGTLMEVPKTDKEWLTNIRKSIATVVRVYPVIKVPTMKSSAEKIVPAFTTKEFTLFGHCESQYAVKDISYQYLPMEGGRPGNTYGYDLCKDGAYNVTRSINFDRCSDRTLVQHTGLSNRTTAAHENHGTVESRSSVAHYTVCGKKGQMQIQNLTAEGLFLSNPYGYETEKMQVMTNQTFRLSFVKVLSKPTPVKVTRDVKTWLIEVASPYGKRTGSNEKPWVNFHNKAHELTPYLAESVMTGESYENMKQSFKATVVNHIRKVAQILNSRPQPSKQAENNIFDTQESECPKLMQTATRLIRSLDKPFLTQIWQTLHKEGNTQNIVESILYTDALASSGSSAAISLLLEQMQKGAITDIRAKTIFVTITNSIVNPESIPHLLNYVMNLEMKHKPYLTITAHVNVASAVRRVCTDSRFVAYSVPRPILGNKNCNPTGILNKYWKYLEQKLKQSTKPFERASWVEAIANLGNTQALPVLKEVITGQHGKNASIRVMGIYGLLHHRMPMAPRHEIFKILTPLTENFQEDIYLRQTAILVLASWHPEPIFWQNIASLTWRDPSKEIGSFIYSLMSGTSRSSNPKLYKQGEYATQALKRAKPYPPSFMYSFSYLWAKLSPSYHLSTEFALSKLNSNETVVPNELFTYLYNSHGGLDYTVLESCSYAFNADELFFRIWEKISTGHSQLPRNPRLSNPKDYSNFLQLITRELNFNGKTVLPHQLFQVIRMFDNLEVFAPIDKDILEYAPQHGRELLNTLLKGTEVTLVKFFDPSPIEMYIPLESGMPMTYRVSLPIIFSVIGNAKLRIPNIQKPYIIDVFTAPEIDLEVDKNAKFISTYTSSVGVIAPWEKKEVFTDVYMTINVNDPSKINLSLINSINADYVNTTLGLYVKPNIDTEYPVAHTHNVPVVGVRSMWPDQKIVDMKPLFVSDDEKPVERVRYEIPKAFTGVSGFFRYNGDLPNPFNFGALYDTIRNPQIFMRSHSPSVKRWDIELIVSPSDSETKSFNISNSIWLPTIIFSTPINNFTHVKDQIVDYTRDYPYGFTTRLHLNGSQERYYEASLGVVSLYDKENVKNYGVRVTSRRSALPGFDDKKSAFCFNMTATSPKLYNFYDLLELVKVEQNVMMSHKADMFLGETCQNNRIGSVTGHLKLSEKERQRIENRLGREASFTPYQPLAPFYDQSELVLNFQKASIPEHFLNATYQLYDLLRGQLYPHAEYKYFAQNQQNKIKVFANRLMKSHDWQGMVELPTESIKFYSQQFPKESYQIVPTGGMSQLKYECVINNEKIRTFDNVWYKQPVNSEINNCWTVAAINKLYPERMQILVRRPTAGGFEAMISSTDYKINVEIFKNKILVNGNQVQVTDQARWINDANGVPFAKVLTQWGKHQVSVPGNVTVSVSDKEITIMPFKAMKAKFNGICGDFNSEDQNEFIGPKNCFYQNVTKFVHSWALSQGSQCQRQNLARVQTEVKAFQQKCAKAYPPMFEWEAKKDLDCETFVYPIKKTEDVLCVSTNSVAMCLPGCKEVQYVTTDEVYYCYLYDDIPADVKPNVARGYMTTSPIELPDVTQAIRTRQAYMCE